jgi:hypothetical protein
MKWVGRLYHNLQHDPSENPSPTATATVTVKPSIYQAGIAFLWPTLAAVYGTETLHICIKKTWHEDEVGGVPQS